jgi:hypothetical protein
MTQWLVSKRRLPVPPLSFEMYSTPEREQVEAVIEGASAVLERIKDRLDRGQMLCQLTHGDYRPKRSHERWECGRRD